MDNRELKTDNEEDREETLDTCAGCGCKHFRVAWVKKKKKRIVRSRECRHCGRRKRTVEKVE